MFAPRPFGITLAFADRMSKYNNVNPGQYKVAGRERPDTLAQERLKNSKVKFTALRPKQQRPKSTRKQG